MNNSNIDITVGNIHPMHKRTLKFTNDQPQKRRRISSTFAAQQTTSSTSNTNNISSNNNNNQVLHIFSFIFITCIYFPCFTQERNNSQLNLHQYISWINIKEKRIAWNANVRILPTQQLSKLFEEIACMLNVKHHGFGFLSSKAFQPILKNYPDHKIIDMRLISEFREKKLRNLTFNTKMNISRLFQDLIRARRNNIQHNNRYKKGRADRYAIQVVLEECNPIIDCGQFLYNCKKYRIAPFQLLLHWLMDYYMPSVQSVSKTMVLDVNEMVNNESIACKKKSNKKRNRKWKKNTHRER